MAESQLPLSKQPITFFSGWLNNIVIDSGKIEVKVVKAGYYNEEDGTIKFISDEDDVNEFGNVLMAILVS